MIPFIEKRLNNLSPKQSDKKLPQAAVLILITDNENDYSIVFTERSKKLPSHAGEVAFPGGKKEEEDRNLIETVLRETHEEIGVEPNSIRIPSADGKTWQINTTGLDPLNMMITSAANSGQYLNLMLILEFKKNLNQKYLHIQKFLQIH